MAANNNYVEAQYELGTLYYHGWEVEKDYTKALKYFEMAEKRYFIHDVLEIDFFREHMNLFSMLGVMYLKGLGVNEDHKKAFEKFQIAATNGYKPACQALGILYFNGQGVNQDYKKAFEWIKIALESDNSGLSRDCSLIIGQMYQQGLGVKQNYKNAAKYYKIALKHGCQDAKQLLDSIKQFL